MNTIVYTAIYGNYDVVRDFGIPVTLFTEVTHKRPENKPRLQAKYFKCNPHECLSEHDVSIWIDGSAIIHDENFIDRCVSLLGQSDIMCFVHPEGRRCIYDEAEYCRGMEKYRWVDIDGQVNTYRDEGYPKQNGLWACGLVVRKNNDITRRFNALWWEHNKEYTYQDQLSFPVLINETGINLKTLWLNQHDNDLITFNRPHKNDS